MTQPSRPVSDPSSQQTGVLQTAQKALSARACDALFATADSGPLTSGSVIEVFEMRQGAEVLVALVDFRERDLAQAVERELLDGE